MNGYLETGNDGTATIYNLGYQRYAQIKSDSLPKETSLEILVINKILIDDKPNLVIRIKQNGKNPDELKGQILNLEVVE